MQRERGGEREETEWVTGRESESELERRVLGREKERGIEGECLSRVGALQSLYSE